MIPNPTLWEGDFGLSLELPEECWKDCSTPGQDASEAVDYWLPRLSWEDASDEDVADYLKEVGAWEDLEDPQENRKRLLWIASCEIRELPDYPQDV